MSASGGNNVIAGVDYQQTLDDLKAMFPDVALVEVHRLVEQYRGDLPQIIDKLLQQQTPSPPTRTGTTEAPTMNLGSHPGNQANSSSAAISSPQNANQTISQPIYQSYTVDHSLVGSPWGPIDGSLRPQQSFPSAFAKPVPVAPTEPVSLENSYSAPITIAQSGADLYSVPIQPTQAVDHRSPVSRSISPPPISRSSPVSSTSSASSGAYMPKASTTSTNPITNAIHFGTSPQSTNVVPLSSTPVKAIYNPESIGEAHEDTQFPQESVPVSAASASLGSPLNSALPSYVHSNPRLIAISPPVTSPMMSTGPISSPYSAPNQSSPLGSSLGQSRTNDDRSARLRATEAQFQALMASMSEMETVSQHEMELKEARIVQLEAQLAALASEKSTWIGRLEKVTQTTVQLRDQVEQQSKMIDLLADQLKSRDEQIAQLQTKLLSYKPIEGADQFRMAFESSIQTAIPALDEQGANGQAVLQQVMADFAATFQRALAASLLAPLQPK